MTNEERIERFRNGKITINCETEEEAKSFIKWCFDNGMCWESGTEDEIFFDMYKNKTCYSFDFFTGDEYLGYDSKSFYKREGYEVIKYKDFMGVKRITNLEYVASKGLIKEGCALCYTAHICKYGISCINKSCSKCEFNGNVDLCVQTLLEEYKELIKLTQFEFDLLKAKLETHGYCYFSACIDLRFMKDNGYFNGIADTSMTLREILDNCEVIEDGIIGTKK